MPSHTKEIEQIMDDIQITNTEQIHNNPIAPIMFNKEQGIVVDKMIKQALNSQKQQILDAVGSLRQYINEMPEGKLITDEEIKTFLNL